MKKRIFITWFVLGALVLVREAYCEEVAQKETASSAVKEVKASAQAEAKKVTKEPDYLPEEKKVVAEKPAKAKPAAVTKPPKPKKETIKHVVKEVKEKTKRAVEETEETAAAAARATDNLLLKSIKTIKEETNQRLPEEVELVGSEEEERFLPGDVVLARDDEPIREDVGPKFKLQF